MLKHLILIYFILCLSTCKICGQNENSFDEYQSITKKVNFETEDGIVIYGDLAWQNKKNPTIILFHQGRSNARGEYQYTLPTFFHLGYNVLAIDQRLGGELYGSENRTVISNSKLKENQYTYCDAQLDAKAALDYVLKKSKGKVMLLGSSYSATLSIRLAAEYKDKVSGVLAFSPASGGPMVDCLPDEALTQYNGQVLVLRPDKEMQIESVQKQFEMIKKAGHQTHVAKNGVHGSSMLVEERVGESVQKNWDRVLKFLKAL